MTMTPEALKQFLPHAIKWARDGEDFIMRLGRELTPSEEADAVLAGVRYPKKIKVCIIPKIPQPDVGSMLGLANQIVGLVTERTAGLTLNYGIFIRQDCARDSGLFFHEFVHVAQYERLGDFEGFLPQYLDECIRYGYPNAPLEREAIEFTAKRKNA